MNIIFLVYSCVFSPVLHSLAHAVGGSAGCRFSPSCSEYTFSAIKEKGIVKGVICGIMRIARCHPWSKVCGTGEGRYE